MDHNKKVLKVIKTLRIYDGTTLQEQTSILLEEIDVHRLKIANYMYRSTFIQRRDCLYFYRRCKNVYKLTKYDLTSG